MVRYHALAILLFAMTFSVACSSARRTGSTVKNATVAAGQEVGDKTEDVAEAVADKTVDVAETVADKTEDASITSAIKMKFAQDKTVDAFDINVDTKDGNVTLTGKVQTKAEADQAVMLAQRVEGVNNVTPRLTITNQ